MKRSAEGESGRDAHILASAPSLEAAPQRSAGTPHGIGATPWGTKSATRRARFAHVCAGGAPATGVASRCQRARHKANVTGARRGSRDRYRYGGTTPFKRGPGLYGPRGKPPADLWFKGCLKTAVYCGGSSRLSTQFNPANQF